MSELLNKKNMQEMIEKEFEKVYNGFDLDGNGSINQSEMYNFLETLFGQNYQQSIDIS
jgi:Ca2+-binding EF-hand superfamily protein